MLNPSDTLPQTNPGFSRMFAPGRLTLGVLFAIESYPGDAPTMVDQIRLAKRAEQAGFAALGVRDVPLRDPSFGDLGQIFDPWTWLGYVAGQTSSIALFTAAIVLPLRHPLHTAKAAASIDRLTGGRLVMGIASGRPAANGRTAVGACRLKRTVSRSPRRLRGSLQVVIEPPFSSMVWPVIQLASLEAR